MVYRVAENGAKGNSKDLAKAWYLPGIRLNQCASTLFWQKNKKALCPLIFYLMDERVRCGEKA